MIGEEKLTEEEYKLAEEVIKPIYRKAIQNNNSFAKYGVDCYLAGLKAQIKEITGIDAKAEIAKE